MSPIFGQRIEKRTIGGVKTEYITPREEVLPENRRRILINLHGGAFMWGGGSGGEVESIPIASGGRINVIAVNHRLAPENKFTAASQDIATVYRALLKEYSPSNIGMHTALTNFHASNGSCDGALFRERQTSQQAIAVIITAVGRRPARNI